MVVVLLLGLVALGAVYWVLAAGTRVAGGQGLWWDAALLRQVGELRTGWLSLLVDVVTRTGGVLVVVPVAVGAGWLWRRAQRSDAVLLVVAAATSSLLATGSKSWVQRPRPEVITPLAETTTLSFPSGHTLTAVGAYGVIAVLLWRHSHRRSALLAAGWVLLVGASRIYLGVHYPTDVLASLVAGTWLLVVLLALQGWWRTRAAASRTARSRRH